MNYITLKNSKIPSLGLGTWKLEGKACVESVANAIDIGYRHIDTAQIYMNEHEVGEAIAATGIARNQLFITTKVWVDNVAPEALKDSVEESLKKLKTDYVDMLLLHWPVNAIPLHKQIRALQAVQDWGMTKLIGVSNYPVALLQKIIDDTDAEITNNQVEYHPYLSQASLISFMRRHNMALTAYCPLARGTINTDPVILEIAAKHGKTASQVGLRWLIQQDQVMAIPKASGLQHLRDNFNIFDFALSSEDMARIFALANPKGRLVNPDWGPEWDSDRSEAA